MRRNSEKPKINKIVQREIVVYLKMAPVRQPVSICVLIITDSYEFSSAFLSHSCSNHAIALNYITMVIKNSNHFISKWHAEIILKRQFYGCLKLLF